MLQGEGDEMALNVIRMICSWAVSRHRKGNNYRAFIAASVLRLYEDQQRVCVTWSLISFLPNFFFKKNRKLLALRLRPFSIC